MKVGKSLDYDPNPGDLLVSKVKSLQRGMEAWTSVMYMYLDDLWVGVKSQSNPAIAGSCRNMPKYSLLLLAYIVKTRMENAGRYATVLFPTQKI